jgi:hypothetical protein
MQQLGHDSTVKITGAGAPTRPDGPSVSTRNAGMWLLHYLALEILEKLRLCCPNAASKAIDGGKENTADWTSFSQS